MLPSLLLSLLLTVSDPRNDVNDAILPIISAIPDTSVFDVERISVAESTTFNFSITMGSLANPWQLSHGFSFPIIEIYLNDNDPEAGTGSEVLLPGSDMLLDEGEDWNYAFRLTGDRLFIYRGFEGSYEDVTELVSGTLRREGNNELIVETALPIPEDYSLYGLVGSYDPFSSTGWRTLNSSDAAGNLQAISPVLEVIADDVETQAQALSTKTLPRIDVAQQQNHWLWVVGGGLLLSLLAFIGWIASFFGRSSKKSSSAPSVIARQAAQSHAVQNQKVQEQTNTTAHPTIAKRIEREASTPIGRAGRTQTIATEKRQPTTVQGRIGKATSARVAASTEVEHGSSFPKAHQFKVNETAENFHDSHDSTSLWGRQGRDKALRPAASTVQSKAHNSTITTMAEETTSLGQIKSIVLHKNKTAPSAAGMQEAKSNVEQNSNIAKPIEKRVDKPEKLERSSLPQPLTLDDATHDPNSLANKSIKNHLRPKASYISNAPQHKLRHLPKNILPKEEKAS